MNFRPIYGKRIRSDSPYGKTESGKAESGKVESGKTEKRKPIRIRGKTEVDKRNVSPTTIASFDWLALFRFSNKV